MEVGGRWGVQSRHRGSSIEVVRIDNFHLLTAFNFRLTEQNVIESTYGLSPQRNELGLGRRRL